MRRDSSTIANSSATSIARWLYYPLVTLAIKWGISPLVPLSTNSIDVNIIDAKLLTAKLLFLIGERGSFDLTFFDGFNYSHCGYIDGLGIEVLGVRLVYIHPKVDRD